jgi:hypothetical protein
MVMLAFAQRHRWPFIRRESNRSMVGGTTIERFFLLLMAGGTRPEQMAA